MCDTQCMCLPSLTGTFCGWIDKQDGVVHPCAPGCCNPACSETPPSMIGEYKQTRGVALPPGFGLELKTSDMETWRSWEAPFAPVGKTTEPPYHKRFFFMLLFVVLMVFMALLLV